MKIYIKKIQIGELRSRFEIYGIPDEKCNDFQAFLGSRIARLGVEYEIIACHQPVYVSIYYPTAFFGFSWLTKYHGIYLTWILEWIDKNNN